MDVSQAKQESATKELCYLKGDTNNCKETSKLFQMRLDGLSINQKWDVRAAIIGRGYNFALIAIRTARDKGKISPLGRAFYVAVLKLLFGLWSTCP
jgi:hypothetical protein